MRKWFKEKLCNRFVIECESDAEARLYARQHHSAVCDRCYRHAGINTTAAAISFYLRLFPTINNMSELRSYKTNEARAVSQSLLYRASAQQTSSLSSHCVNVRQNRCREDLNSFPFGRTGGDHQDTLVLHEWRLSNKTWNPTTSAWMKQLTWLRSESSTLETDVLCLALRTPSGACHKRRSPSVRAIGTRRDNKTSECAFVLHIRWATSAMEPCCYIGFHVSAHGALYKAIRRLVQITQKTYTRWDWLWWCYWGPVYQKHSITCWL